MTNSNGVRRVLAEGVCPADNVEGGRNWAKGPICCVAEEQNLLFILLVLLGVPMYVDAGYQ